MKWRGRRSPATSGPTRKAQAPAMRCPVPTEVQPFTRYDPVLARVEAEIERDHHRRPRRVPLHCQGRPIRGLDLRWDGPGRALRVVEGDESISRSELDPNAIRPTR